MFPVYSKALEADVPANLRSLAYYLHSCGKRSSQARRYEVMIRTAVAEHRSPLSQCVLPSSFYDLRLSTLDIADLEVSSDVETPSEGVTRRSSL